MNFRELIGCLSDREIVSFLLQKDLLDKDEEVRISSHISTCCECFDRYYELRMFHQILESELTKPISGRVARFSERIAH